MSVSHIRRWLDMLMPQPCLFCLDHDGEVQGICDACLADMSRTRHQCLSCGIEIPQSASQCGPCLTVPPHFDRVIADFRYIEPLDQLIHRFKFGQQLYLSRTIAELMLKVRQFPATDLCVPVPLHKDRQCDRGFNQASEIAQQLCRMSPQPEKPLKTSRNLLVRHQATEAQSGLSRDARHRNLKNAFRVDKGDILGLDVLLIDDVMTTGSTVNECSRILKLAGAASVTVWVIARA